MKVQVLVSVLSVAAICGGEALQKQSLSPDSKRSSTVDVETKTLHDENFSYTVGKKHSFVRLNPNATLNDLNDFVYAICWNGYLRPKFHTMQKLSREDAILLDFCVKAQLNMVDVLTVAVLGDMTGQGFQCEFPAHRSMKSPSQDSGLEDIYSEWGKVFVDLKSKFLDSNEGIRMLIREWAGEYRKVPPDVMKRVWGDIERATGAADNAGRPTYGEIPWYYWEAAHLASPTVSSAARLWYVTTPDQSNEIENGALELKTPAVDMKNKWMNIRNAMSAYLDEMINMRGELKSTRVSKCIQDSQTRSYLQRILSESDNARTVVCQYLDYVMYDLPFCVMTYKVKGKLRACKGRWNDDEDMMKDVMAEYCQAIAGTEMLKHIRTRYAANGYVAAVEFLKDELSDSDFKSFVNESKLYRIVQEVDETGQPNNKLSQITD